MQPDIISNIEDALEDLRKMNEKKIRCKNDMLNYKIQLILHRRKIRDLCKQNETIQKIIELSEIGFFI